MSTAKAEKLRVVLDTNVYISALMFGGLPGVPSRFGTSPSLIISPAFLDELEEELRAKFEMTIGDAAFLRSRLENVARGCGAATISERHSRRP